MNLKEFILIRYDWFIYGLAFRSLRRICHRSPGIGYVIELYIKGWNEQRQITDELKKVAETFYKELVKNEHRINTIKN